MKHTSTGSNNVYRKYGMPSDEGAEVRLEQIGNVLDFTESDVAKVPAEIQARRKCARYYTATSGGTIKLGARRWIGQGVGQRRAEE